MRNGNSIPPDDSISNTQTTQNCNCADLFHAQIQFLRRDLEDMTRQRNELRSEVCRVNADREALHTRIAQLTGNTAGAGKREAR